jgi:hypothetical protein
MDDNNDINDKSNLSCIPYPKENCEIKQKGKLVSEKKFLNSLNSESKENTGGKLINQKKFIKSDIFFLSKRNSLNPNFRQINFDDETEFKNNRKTSRPDYIRNPFESQISNFH